MLDTLIILATVVLLVLALVWQWRNPWPQRKREPPAIHMYCAWCVHRDGEDCTNSASPVHAERCGPVRIGVEGDGQMDTVEGGEVVQGTTDSNGEFSTTFTSGTMIGLAGVRAELLVRGDFDYRVLDHDRQVIQLGTSLYLPLVVRSD